MKVKICGITSLEDALIASELGAHALGFIFVTSSPRFISPNSARKIIQELPPFVVPVGVVADFSREDILDLISCTGIRCVQLHGNESPEQCSGFPVPVYKSFRVHNTFQTEILHQYPGAAYLLDTHVDGTLGGTGKTFDWDIAQKAKIYGRIILAGGLHPGNISAAIQKVKPYAVDVNSGVETAPGKKDKKKLDQLFERINSIH